METNRLPKPAGTNSGLFGLLMGSLMAPIFTNSVVSLTIPPFPIVVVVVIRRMMLLNLMNGIG